MFVLHKIYKMVLANIYIRIYLALDYPESATRRDEDNH